MSMCALILLTADQCIVCKCVVCPCVGFTSEGANRKDEVRKFLEMATLMKGLDHKNILPLVGVCAEEGYVPLVLYPYSEEGSVHSFLDRYKFSPERQQVRLCMCCVRLRVCVGACKCCSIHVCVGGGACTHAFGTSDRSSSIVRYSCIN